MVEKLNSTVLSALRACTSKPTDWVDCLQSVAMSIRSQPHESTGLSPYEMMFGIPMRLPTELEDEDIPTDMSNYDMAEIMPEPPVGPQIFEKVDKIRQIIHNSAAGNISRAKSKQVYYFNQRHRGTPLQIGDKVLHYNRRAGQRVGDKLNGKWLGPYEIVGMKPNGKYQLKDDSGYVLKTYVNGSNLKLYLSSADFDDDSAPDLIPADQIPSQPDSVDELLKSIKNEKDRPKSRGKKREMSDVDLLFPGPEAYKKPKKEKVQTDEPVGDMSAVHIPPSQKDRKWTSEHVNMIKLSKKVTFGQKNKQVHSYTPPPTPSKEERETSRKSVNKNKLGIKLEKMKAKSEKNKFLDEMVSNTKDGVRSSSLDSVSSEDDIVVVGIEKRNDFFFNPLTIQERNRLCQRTSLIHRKHIPHTNLSENLGERTPRIKSIKGDGNCFFRALSVAVTGWEVGHLLIRKLVCDHINSVGPYTKNIEGKTYLSQSKMKTSTTFATDVEIMAAAQVLGTDIYVYHTYGDKLRWLRFACVHSMTTNSSIYLDNRYGNGKTGHFDYVTGLN